MRTCAYSPFEGHLTPSFLEPLLRLYFKTHGQYFQPEAKTTTNFFSQLKNYAEEVSFSEANVTEKRNGTIQFEDGLRCHEPLVSLRL